MDSSTKSLLLKSIRRGLSLNRLSSLFGLPRTTAYYHLRKIRGKTVHGIEPKIVNDDILGEFIGLFAGDGYAIKTDSYQYRIYLYFNLNEVDMAEDIIQNVLFKLFQKRPRIYQVGNCINLVYYSREIFNLIKMYLDWPQESKKTYGVHLKNSGLSDSFIQGFLRGCLESDGYISKSRISFASVSKRLGDDMTSALDRLKIGYSVNVYQDKRGKRAEIVQITVSRFDRERFLALIKPRKKKNDASAGKFGFWISPKPFELPNVRHVPRISRVESLEGSNPTTRLPTHLNEKDRGIA